jgi:hypothetical protein
LNQKEMMKPTIAPCAESTALTHSPARATQQRGPRRLARSLLAALGPAMAAALAACQSAPEPEPAPPVDDPIASGEQSLSASDCRRELSRCVSSSGGVSDVDQCTLDFEDCLGQAAPDPVGQAGPFAIVRPIVSRVVSGSARTLRGLVDVADALPALALARVNTCREGVVTCLDTAATDLDVGTCADSLDGCVDGVVDIIDPVLDPLPGPNASGIATATEACRADARGCLVGALSLNDISACSAVLGACVDGIEVIVDDSVDDVNDIIDPVAVPKPGAVIDCTLELTQCLAALQNPFDCAEQARICASQ